MNQEKMLTTIQRNRRMISNVLYGIGIILCLYVLYDPDSILRLFNQNPQQQIIEPTTETAEKEEDNLYAMLGAEFKPAEKPEAVKVVHLPFVPRQHSCESLFEKAGYNFTYSEFYWEHSDSYKSALQMCGILREGTVDEVSWIFHQISLMPFVETVCETGFRAGHYSFHWLTAKPEILVYSFESNKYNYTNEMSLFMTAEFPDRFYFYQGATSETISKFKAQNSDAKCDLIYVDTVNKQKEDVLHDLEEFKKMRHPVQHMVIMLEYRNGSVANTRQIWKEKVNNGEIVEQFSCDFVETPSDLSSRNDLGVGAVFVGTFVK